MCIYSAVENSSPHQSILEHGRDRVARIRLINAYDPSILAQFMLLLFSLVMILNLRGIGHISRAYTLGIYNIIAHWARNLHELRGELAMQYYTVCQRWFEAEHTASPLSQAAIDLIQYLKYVWSNWLQKKSRAIELTCTWQLRTPPFIINMMLLNTATAAPP